MRGRDLKEKRLQLGLTQEQVAKEFGFHRNVIIRWERSSKVRRIIELAMSELARRRRKS